jgi:hypothetical protein
MSIPNHNDSPDADLVLESQGPNAPNITSPTTTRSASIGLSAKDRFAMNQPKKDAQFTNYFSDPLLARFYNAAFGGAIAIPAPPRSDLALFFAYTTPIASADTPSGPTADLLRLNTGITHAPLANASRLGLLGGDNAGYPNGRRLFDDVLDITLRSFAGGVFSGGAFNVTPNNRLRDGVNVNDVPFRPAFPYLGDCPSGRDRRHLDPGEPGGGGFQPVAATLVTMGNVRRQILSHRRDLPQAANTAAVMPEIVMKCCLTPA